MKYVLIYIVSFMDGSSGSIVIDNLPDEVSCIMVREQMGKTFWKREDRLVKDWQSACIKR